MNVHPFADRPAFAVNQDNVGAQLRETAAQRRWLGAIAPLGALFDNRVFQDPLSLTLQNWFFEFRTLLRAHPDPAEGPDQIAGRLVPVLDRLLTDTVFGGPLTEQAVLGSDGETYLPESIELFRRILDENITDEGLLAFSPEIANLPQQEQVAALAELKQQILQRSPRNLQNPAHLSTINHPVIPDFIRWKNEYIDHIAPPPAPEEPPRNPQMNIRAIRERRLQGNRIRVFQAREAFNQGVQAQHQAQQEQGFRVDAAFHAIHERIRQNEAEHNVNLDQAGRDIAAARQALRQRRENVEARVVALERRVFELGAGAENAQRREAAVEAATRQLEIVVASCEAAAAKRESSRLGILEFTFMLVGCAVSIYLLAQTGGASGGAAGGILPMKDGVGLFGGFVF